MSRAGDGESRARPEVLRDPVHAAHHVAHVHVHLGGSGLGDDLNLASVTGISSGVQVHVGSKVPK